MADHPVQQPDHVNSTTAVEAMKPVGKPGRSANIRSTNPLEASSLLRLLQNDLQACLRFRIYHPLLRQAMHSEGHSARSSLGGR